ncbi:MAG TPA: hypothetical protein VFT56_04840 [Sphingomonas sp.]|nr:hypothetical protein [Sphingomonas sp.]
MMLRPLLLAVALAAAPAAARHADTPAAKPLRASIDGLPFGELPEQQLPARGCAAYLWSKGNTHALVAMASADPAQLRLSLDGTIADYPRVAQQGLGGFGFGRTTTYRTGDVTAILDMAIQAQADLSEGAAVPSGTLTLERPGKDTVVLPVGGLIGCAGASGGT